MCGIAGVARRDRRPVLDPEQLARLFSAALAHRGPDGEGAWHSSSDDVLLVHRRLAILDPSRDAGQPMTSADGRHVLVFNGEIYNYRELRREREDRGDRFRTTSDTEVLLRLMISDGPEALGRLRGMFAFAFWDSHARSLILARDRFGIKPLYVAAGPGRIAFASELAALRTANLVDSQPSPAAVLAFLSWGSVPAPLSWSGNAEMLEAGTWLEWRQDGRERRGRFADPRTVYRTTNRMVRDEREFREAVGAAVRDSVRAHLVADVPVGLFLSGGIDSGAIVSAAGSGATLATFTVAFDDRTSEAARAREVAETFGTTHHELRLTASHLADDLPSIVARLDQPTIDAVNSYCVAGAVAKAGIKAVLSGTGGDELFGGYPSFRRLPPAMRAKGIAGAAWPIVAAAGRRAVPARLRARWQHFASTNGNIAEAYRAQRGFILPSELATIAGPALIEPKVFGFASEELARVERSLLSPAGTERPSASVARLESALYLQSQLLRDIDVMSMAHGLEVRVPFVDHELLGTVWPELGRHRSLLTGKALLHSTLARPLPAAVVRHPKQGFTLPFATWMRHRLAGFVQEGMQRAARSGWIASDAPADVWSSWLAGRVHWTRPWGLAVLGHLS